MSSAKEEIKTLVDKFAAELVVLVRKGAVEALTGAMGATETPPTVALQAQAATPAKRGPGRPPKASPSPTAPPAPAKPQARKPAPAARSGGTKRDPADLAALVERVCRHIKANPGQRIEQLKDALQIPTKDMTLPIKKLLAAQRISSQGQKRGTTYS